MTGNPAGGPHSIDDQLGLSTRRPAFRRAAIAYVAILVAATVAVLSYGGGATTEIRPFLPICATLWASADLLTAFFLYGQFYIAGRVALAVVASAYALTGLLVVPYLYYFPGLFAGASSPVDRRISPWLWATWHVSFAVLVAFAHLLDPTLSNRTVARKAIAPTLATFLVATLGLAIAVPTAVALNRAALPAVLDPTGHYSHAYLTIMIPLIVGANLIACAVVALRMRKPTALQLWVAIALFTAAIDGVVNAASPGRYTLTWYVGKIDSLLTATVVLTVLLWEVFSLYRYLSDVANLDPLTGLKNRRSLASLNTVLEDRRELSPGLAMLVLDLDRFKAFNDTYGHAGGDEALCRVADVLRATVRRPKDSVVRYGGEEFVIVLPRTSRDGARYVAERVRSEVEAQELSLGSSVRARMTVSIGVAYVASSDSIKSADLFARADRALYAAKAGGRNTVVLVDAGSKARDSTVATQDTALKNVNAADA